MDINKYALFADVAETRNFTKSGERMGYTQPGVSHILKTMESEFGFPLFLRTKQGIELTSNAQKILPLIRQLLVVNEQLEQTVSSINGLETGHITIASFASISRNWLPAVIYEFQTKYPGIEIDLLEGGTDDIVSWINNSIADFGLLSKRNTDVLEWISLYKDPLVAILPKDDPLAGESSFPINAMTDRPFIISAEGTDYDIHNALYTSGINPNIRFSSTDDFAIITMVANHLGLSILPQLVTNNYSDQIVTLPLEPYYARDLGIGFRSKQHLTPAAAKFITTITQALPKLVAQKE